MKEHLQQTIEFLRQHVLKNIELIKANEAHIKEVLDWPVTPERTKELNESYGFSKNLLSENNDFINLQVSIMNFVNKYKKVFETEQAVVVNAVNMAIKQSQLSRDDYFRLTVDKDIEYNSAHPYYNDNDFFNQLLVHYQNSENYEMCALLIKIKE
jgi:hypothetical protein